MRLRPECKNGVSRDPSRAEILRSHVAFMPMKALD